MQTSSHPVLTAASRARLSLASCVLSLCCLTSPGAHAQAAQPKPVAKGPDVAATVNGAVIRQQDIDAVLPAQLSPAQRQDKAVRQQALQQLIAQELFWQKAKAAKLDQRPEARTAAQAATRATAAQLYIQQTLKPAQPAEAEIRQRYDQIVANLGPEEFRVSLIETATEADLQAAQALLQSGKTFAEVARKHSQHNSASKGGELNWVSFPVPVVAGRTNGLPVPYAQAIASLQPGQTSAALFADGRWARIHLEAKRPTLVPEFAATRDMLQRALYLQNIERASVQLTTELLKTANIQVYGQP